MINKYDPRLKDHEELNATFVCGKSILKEIWENLQPGKKGELSNQSWIITGPRGAGKSHLLTKLYQDIKADDELNTLWLPLIFPEELYGVNSLYRLLVKIIEEAFRQSNNKTLQAEKKAEFTRLKTVQFTGTRKEKNNQLHDASKKLFSFFTGLGKELGKKFILMLENLQMLFSEQLTNDELKLMRSVIQENPDVFIIIGTALSVVHQIEVYGKPFYHFFKVRRIDQLSMEGIIHFTAITASYYGDDSMHSKIKENRPYIYTFRLLTGGNPRLVLLLYELLRDSAHLSTELILAKIMELTPYFKDRTLETSPQKRIILEALAFGPPSQTATEIAEYLAEDPGSIMEQLKRLKTEGWISGINLEGEGIRKKEVFYTLRDYFYRIWYKMRSGGIDEADVLCMAELVTVLYTKTELSRKATMCDTSQPRTRLIFSRALELMENEIHMRNIERLHKVSEEHIKKEVKDLIDKAEECTDNKDWEELIKTGEKLIQYQDYEADGFFYLGRAYINQKNYKLAIKYNEKVVTLKEDYFKAWHNMGISYYWLKKYEKAIECFYKTVLINEEYYDGWYNMGHTYADLDNHEKAIEYYEKAVSINEDCYKAWNNMGNSFADLGKYEKAIECFKKAVSINDFSISWYNMGYIYADLNNHEKAIKYYKKAVSKKIDYYDAWYNMGMSYAKLSKYEKAIECFKKAVSIKEDKHNAWYCMGLCCIGLGNHKKAIECFEKAISINEDKHNTWSQMGYSFYSLRKYEKAIECFKKAVSIKENNDEAWRGLGYIYAELNNHEKAIKCYKKAVSIKKDYNDAWYEMGISYYKMKTMRINSCHNAYHAYTQYIHFVTKFNTYAFNNYHVYTDIAATIFTPSKSLQTFLAENTTTPEKLEALCQLLLLGKFSAVLNEAEVLLQVKDIDHQTLKKLLFFTQAYLLNLLKTDPGSGTTKETLGFWLKVCTAYYKEEKIKGAFLDFLIHYIKIAGKEKLSLEVVENLITQLREEGITVSDVLLTIIRSIKNPDSREAKKWSVDPLFSEIIKLLSEEGDFHQ